MAYMLVHSEGLERAQYGGPQEGHSLRRTSGGLSLPRGFRRKSNVALLLLRPPKPGLLWVALRCCPTAGAATDRV
jgi:hypothetical protein